MTKARVLKLSTLSRNPVAVASPCEDVDKVQGTQPLCRILCFFPEALKAAAVAPYKHLVHNMVPPAYVSLSIQQLIFCLYGCSAASQSGLCKLLAPGQRLSIKSL